jgi:hypothetical protein
MKRPVRRQSVDVSINALEWWQVGKRTRIHSARKNFHRSAPKPLFRRKIRKRLQQGVGESHAARPCADFYTVSLRFGVDAETCASHA